MQKHSVNPFFPHQVKIEVKCFGKFALYVNDEFVYISNKKAEELLAYLICEKGRPVGKTKLAERLWPDAPAEKAMDSLYKVCRFMKDLERQGVPLPLLLYRDEICLNLSNVASDIDMFEQLYNLRDDVAMCEKAIALYKGPLFFDNCYEWSATQEAFYDIRFVEMVERLVTYYKQKNNTDMAAYYSGLLLN